MASTKVSVPVLGMVIKRSGKDTKTITEASPDPTKIAEIIKQLIEEWKVKMWAEVTIVIHATHGEVVMLLPEEFFK